MSTDKNHAIEVTTDARREAEQRLRDAGLPYGPLEPACGFANSVWLTPDHVLRMNDGRFRHAFRYEADVLARLPDAIPHPEVVAYGQREIGEFLIVERLPGRAFGDAWPMMTTIERRKCTHDLAAITRRLHEIGLADWPVNPWVVNAMAGTYADAYHAPPSLASALLAAANKVRPDASSVLERTAAFVAARMDAFAGDVDVLVHADLHVMNVMVEGIRITGLIDFEGARPSAADVELDMFLRSLRKGRLATDATLADRESIPVWFREGYPEVFAHPRLLDRLEVYEALWHLVQMHHWQPGATWMNDPALELTSLMSGVFRDETVALLQITDYSG